MNKQSILNAAQSFENDFKQILSDSFSFEIKGILNSEMLLVTTLIRDLKIEHIIESGRARGQSTEIIARTLQHLDTQKTKFDSIEFDPNSPDTKVAAKRLAPLSDYVNLHFGDAFKILPQLITKDLKTLILIDGPKGDDALLLISHLLKYNNVIAICVHDFHQNSSGRPLLNKYFQKLFASDDFDFVNFFSNLDSLCWQEHQKYPETKNWGPYKRGNTVMASYGPTLTCLFSPFTDHQQYIFKHAVTQHKQKNDRRRKKMRIISKIIPERIKRLQQVQHIRNMLRPK